MESKQPPALVMVSADLAALVMVSARFRVQDRDLDVTGRRRHAGRRRARGEKLGCVRGKGRRRASFPDAESRPSAHLSVLGESFSALGKDEEVRWGIVGE
jgi:hypothetical protein